MASVSVKSWDGLYPTQFHPDNNQFTNSHLTFGSRGDSFYEILLKQYIQSNGTDVMMYNMYREAIQGMKKKLLRTTSDGLVFIDEMENSKHKNKMDHLACFAGGMLALDGIPEHLEIAKNITNTCWQFYLRNPSGLAPEIASLHEDRSGFTNLAAYNLLRPEMVESLFVLFRITGDSKYREWGWNIFLAFEKHCKTEAGFSGVTDVGILPLVHNDKAESFFLAETLKYLYLLFSPDTLIPFTEYVFSTEAHPTRIFNRNQITL
eukprot:TRINITY_DN15679_c0_g1_i2.p1 TRINITY_DN15679_c0_g1~~TRINITY_DN15679_c0_g1_i2.p1  ORF type:complete len:263 (-),score=53.06 TRINITY_DN15679_c0_g1_i2:176-964(-)